MCTLLALITERNEEHIREVSIEIKANNPEAISTERLGFPWSEREEQRSETTTCEETSNIEHVELAQSRGAPKKRCRAEGRCRAQT